MAQRKIIVSIDGWSSCGKSTVARQLAKELKYKYIDSGAMYRAITLYFLRHHIDFENKNEIEEALQNIELTFKLNDQTDLCEIYLNGENVEYVIRDLLVAEKVSEVAAIAEVRAFGVAQQQALGKDSGIVMDGRDIGTTVFPNAELKIFMTADIVTRVQRRFKEMFEKNPNVQVDEVKQNLEMRDFIDSHREVSPLKKAEDAILLDNTNLTIVDQLKHILHLACKKLNESVVVSEH